jgi:hypothetical protein
LHGVETRGRAGSRSRNPEDFFKIMSPHPGTTSAKKRSLVETILELSFSRKMKARFFRSVSFTSDIHNANADRASRRMGARGGSLDPDVGDGR